MTELPLVAPRDDRSTQGPVKVLYLAGWQRSGSTVLANILGEVPGFFSTGELYYLWDYVWMRDTLCGCGAPFSRCPVWARVVQHAFGGRDGVDAERMRHVALTAGRTRHLPLLLLPGSSRVVEERFGDYLDALERLYGAIQDTTGCRVVVDSSKWPSYCLLLDLLPSIDLYVVHLVRDPRAVAVSWLSRKELPDREAPEVMYRGVVDSSARWTAWNVASEIFGLRRRERYLLLRYEDFLQDPPGAVRKVLSLLDEDDARLPFLSDREVELKPNHTVSGNPNRFTVGQVALSDPADWRRSLTTVQSMAVAALTAPLALHYRYPFRPDHGEDVASRQGRTG